MAEPVALTTSEVADALACPKCGADVPRAEWEETEVGCDMCGTHLAIRCPECGEAFDHVWGARRFEDAARLRESRHV